MSNLVEQARRLRKELSNAKGDEDRLSSENKVLVSLRTDISELETTTGSLVVSIQEVKSYAVKTKRDPEKGQEAVAVWESQQTTLTDNVSSLTEKLSSISVEREKLKANLNDMTVVGRKQKDDDGKFVSKEFMELWMK